MRMAKIGVFFGLEVPAQPLCVGGTLQPAGHWTIAGEWLLERWVRAALQVCEAENFRLLSGNPDQAVFDLAARYGVQVVEAVTWLSGIARRALAAQPHELVVLARGDVLLRHFDPLFTAVEVARGAASPLRIEAAYRVPSERRVETVRPVVMPNGELALHSVATDEQAAWPCPAFEVHPLRSFGMHRHSRQTAFVWINLDDYVRIESQLDVLRAEVMLCRS